MGQLLQIAERWPAGRYIIRRHRHGDSPADPDRHVWGHAIKDREGRVLIEPADGPVTVT
jgi:hypothetical protein